MTASYRTYTFDNLVQKIYISLKIAFLHWNTKFVSCGYSSVWSLTILPQKLYDGLEI